MLRKEVKTYLFGLIVIEVPVQDQAALLILASGEVGTSWQEHLLE
jgi:hypothetical protein